ncbi:Methyltransferase type 11 [Dehalogenimonas lykanthroporepellens BL-DC-9]|nr:Methyltransferase type 11 [Dehalogenimonas lykanthroporepellens BL-DC-9]
MIATFYSLVIDRALRELRRTLPEFAGLKPGDRVLDVCCGTGDQAIRLAEQGIEVHGIDLNGSMLATAESHKRRAGLDNVSFGQADASALLFPNRSFDYATTSLALHEKPREVQLQVLEEMRRVVKKGGGLILADFAVPPLWYIRLVEGLVGGEHYACFKAYTAAGG